MTITFNNLPVRAIISTTSPAAHYLQLDFLQALRLLSPLFALCFLLALGLKLRPAAMVKGSDLRQGGGRLYQAGVGAVHHRAFHRRV